jgi:hypothetical protein
MDLPEKQGSTEIGRSANDRRKYIEGRREMIMTVWGWV